MASITPYKWYSLEEWMRLVDKQAANRMALRGYVIQTDVMSKQYRLVHWKDASGAKEPEGKARKPADEPVEIIRQRTFSGLTMDKPAPLVRRKPGDRVDSLAAKMMLQIQASGKMPGADDPRTAQIVGESWKTGRPITGEMVQTLAARMLARSEADKKRRDYKRVTTTPN